ncbi:MAG: hypothetical protein JNM56_14260 [Planctomycetia bacterium]|nr:hypothetical protein [Planctomycetia bacterium]
MSAPSAEPASAASDQNHRYRMAAALLRKWMSEEKSYDEGVGAALEQELNDVSPHLGTSHRR